MNSRGKTVKPLPPRISKAGEFSRIVRTRFLYSARKSRLLIVSVLSMFLIETPTKSGDQVFNTGISSAGFANSFMSTVLD